MKDFTVEDRRFEITVPFDCEPGPTDLSDRMIAGETGVRLTCRRRWRARLFSRPWKPWLNGVEYVGDGFITSWELTNPMDLSIRIGGRGDLKKYLVRI